MPALETIQTPPALPEKQRAALISLLADEDPAVYEMVRTKLLAFGPTASQWLRPYTLSEDPTLRRRAVEIVVHQARRASDQKFLEFCKRNGEELDLEEAIGLLAHTRYPDANLDAYRALFDTWADEVRSRIESAGSSETVLSIINRFLYGELGFKGNEQYSFEPDACYLNRIVDKRAGNPIGLCAIYLFLARRLRLPVAGIGLPGHFLCRYQGSKQEIFIDCFRRGAFLSKADCVKYLHQTHFGYVESQLSPSNPRRIVLRMCHNLVSTYGHLEMTEEARRVQRYVRALTK
jgi:regulator of sirC expression with transglutaminase-like and TPR domain